MQKIKDFIYFNRKEILLTIISILGVFFLFNNKNNNSKEEIIIEEKKEVIEKIVVDIKGEVKTPGTYEVDENDRIIDVIEKSGGLTDKACTESINLSEKVKDEMLIVIPSIDSDTKPVEEKKTSNTSSNKSSDGKVSVNKASIQELMTIKGIGETKAKAIVDYRNKNGLFKTIEEINNVSGIGKTTFEKIKDYIKL